MRYGYVCTNFNNSHLTMKAIETLMGNAVRPEIVVVVDNKSTPDEAAMLKAIKERFDCVRILLNPENVGYFSGLNLGLDAVRSEDLDCCIVGNNDLEFPTGFGEQLATVIRDRASDPVISPYIETLDGFPQNPHVVSGISRARELMYDLYYSNFSIARLVRMIAKVSHRVSDRTDEQAFGVSQYIYQGHGSCYVLTRKFFEEFGSLWAPTFMMSEEYFLSKQLSDAGYQVYYDARITVQHRCNGSIQAIPARRAWGMARDAHRVYRRYVKPWHRQGD